jgi:hypothetical protein
MTPDKIDETNGESRMRTHEETWAHEGGTLYITKLNREGEESPGATIGEVPGRAQLAAAAPVMARLLLRLGLGAGQEESGETPSCAVCHHAIAKGFDDHAPGCAIVVTLVRAGVVSR